MHILLSLLFLLLSIQPILAQDKELTLKNGYLKNWPTDIQIWYNSGGWYSFLNYFFVGDADVVLRVRDNVAFNYNIKKYRLYGYSYNDIENHKKRIGGGSIPGFIESINNVCGYKSYGEYCYSEDMITCKINMDHNYRMGSGSDIRYTFMKFRHGGHGNNHLRRYTEARFHTGDFYEKLLISTSGSVVCQQDSLLCDTATVLTPFFPMIWDKILKGRDSYKDCIIYKATSNNVYIKAFKKKGTAGTVLSINYDGVIPSSMVIDGCRTEFRCIQKDFKGNWIKLECYDVIKEQVTDTISRTIKYL